jgi:RNA polymerase sigma factor (sigma-70 family)
MLAPTHTRAMPAAEPDAELLARWRDGDTVAGNALVRRHFDMLYRFFSGRLDEGVPDLVQQTFLGAMKARDRLSPDVNFRAYLLGIAHRLLLMAYRSRRRHDAVFARGDTSAAAQLTSPSRAIARRERQRALLVSLRELSLEHQVVVQLLYWEDLSIDEIAAIVGVQPGTVKSRLHRARNILRQTLSEHAPAPNLVSSIEDFDAWARSLWAAGPGEPPDGPDGPDHPDHPDQDDEPPGTTT